MYVVIHNGTHIDRIPPNVVGETFQPQHPCNDRADVYPHPELECKAVLPIDRAQRSEAIHGEEHDVGSVGLLVPVSGALGMRVRRQLLAVVHETADDHVRVPYRLDLLEPVLVR